MNVFLDVSSNGQYLMINFPQQHNWQGLVSEIETIPSYHLNVTCDGCQTACIAGNYFDFIFLNYVFLSGGSSLRANGARPHHFFT